MSIASAIIAKQGEVADAYTAVSNMGGTLPATQNLSNLPTAISSIPSGSVTIRKASTGGTGGGMLLYSGASHPSGPFNPFDPLILNKDNEVTVTSGIYSVWDCSGGTSPTWVFQVAINL